MSSAPKILVLGLMSRMPVAGVVWQTLHYLVGLKNLGYDVYYAEAHGCTPRVFIRNAGDDGWAMAAKFIDDHLRPYGFGDKWCFQARFVGDHCYGLSESQLKNLYKEAALIINLHGGTDPLPEHHATNRLVYLETDPVDVQIEVFNNNATTIDYLSKHCAFFTFGENLGQPDCKLPVSERFQFKPTRQPVVMDFWDHLGGRASPPLRGFTTIGNWKQPWRNVTFQGQTYHWSKHLEFMKIIDLPRRTGQNFELMLNSYEPADKQMLESHGWTVRDATEISDYKDYQSYIASSRGEFTVAKDQNVRLRSGWFSDRAVTYLAAGRPVITQETGFSNILPTGSGLMPFNDMTDLSAAVASVNADYDKHCKAAREIARECFAAQIVLRKLLDEVGV